MNVWHFPDTSWNACHFMYAPPHFPFLHINIYQKWATYSSRCLVHSEIKYIYFTSCHAQLFETLGAHCYKGFKKKRHTMALFDALNERYSFKNCHIDSKIYMWHGKRTFDRKRHKKYCKSVWWAELQWGLSNTPKNGIFGILISNPFQLIHTFFSP